VPSDSWSVFGNTPFYTLVADIMRGVCAFDRWRIGYPFVASRLSGLDTAAV